MGAPCVAYGPGKTLTKVNLQMYTIRMFEMGDYGPRASGRTGLTIFPDLTLLFVPSVLLKRMVQRRVNPLCGVLFARLIIHNEMRIVAKNNCANTNLINKKKRNGI